jgi:hypothetical protein
LFDRLLKKAAKLIEVSFDAEIDCQGSRAPTRLLMTTVVVVVLVSLFDMKIFPFMRISLRGFAMAIKTYIDNVRIPKARPEGLQTGHVVELNLITPRPPKGDDGDGDGGGEGYVAPVEVRQYACGIEFSDTVVDGVPLPHDSGQTISDATGKDLTPDQREAYLKIFKGLQIDHGVAGDNLDTLDVFEIQKGLKQLGHKFTLKEVEAMIGLADREADEASELRSRTQMLVEGIEGAYDTARGKTRGAQRQVIAAATAKREEAEKAAAAAKQAAKSAAAHGFGGVFGFGSSHHHSASAEADTPAPPHEPREASDGVELTHSEAAAAADAAAAAAPPPLTSDELQTVCLEVAASSDFKGGVSKIQSFVGKGLDSRFQYIVRSKKLLPNHEITRLDTLFRKATKNVKWKHAIQGHDGMITEVGRRHYRGHLRRHRRRQHAQIMRLLRV